MGWAAARVVAAKGVGLVVVEQAVLRAGLWVAQGEVKEEGVTVAGSVVATAAEATEVATGAGMGAVGWVEVREAVARAAAARVAAKEEEMVGGARGAAPEAAAKVAA